MRKDEQTPGFQLVFNIDDLPKSGRRFALEANAAACAAIAERLRIPEVLSLSGHADVSATKGRINLKGAVSARLRRECVSSLEPVTEVFDQPFDLVILRSAPEDWEAMSEEERLDQPEIHEGFEFDLADFFIQETALAMDPFPRKEGALSLAETYGKSPESSPFDVLKFTQSPGKSEV